MFRGPSFIASTMQAGTTLIFNVFAITVRLEWRLKRTVIEYESMVSFVSRRYMRSITVLNVQWFVCLNIYLNVVYISL